MKILLVEDDVVSREMLVMRLEIKNFQVTTAEDGESAVNLARTLQPDVILMDMNLPILDGWQATRIIKSDKATAHIPVIGVSAHAMEGDRERALQIGCNEYEPKPINMGALLAKIRLLSGGSINV